MAKIDDIAAHLSAVPLFSQLSAKERKVVAKALGVHEVAEGVMLVRQGEAGDGARPAHSGNVIPSFTTSGASISALLLLR